MSKKTNSPIVIWAYGTYIDIINKGIEQYQNINSDVLFEVIEKIPNDMEFELNNLIAAQDTLPNIILVDDQEIERWIKNYPGLFSHLDEYIDKNTCRDFKAKNITFRSNTYGCPCSSAQVALFYRKDVLQQYLGMDELPEQFTWEEYIQLGIELKERSIPYILPPVNFFSKIVLQSTGNLYYNEKGIISTNNIYETFHLLDTLAENELICPMDIFDFDIILDLMKNDQLFSFIGTPYVFTKIKEVVENNNLTQEWGVSALPKSDVFCYDVNLGGISMLVINHEEMDDQLAVFDFLNQIFVNDNEDSCTFYQEVAEYYDMVPSINYMENRLNTLNNDGCFYNQQVIRFLYELSENVPGIYYGEYNDELGDDFEEIAKKLINKVIDVKDATDEFENICKGVLDLIEPPILDYIVIETPPNKTNYYEYELFDRTGMVVRAYYLDGTTSILYDYNVSPDILSLADTFILVSYTSDGITKTDTQSIRVYARNIIGIVATSREQYYLQTDKLSQTDFRVYATFDEGDNSYIYNFSIYPDVLNTVGKQIITITYNKNNISCSCTTTIDVIRKLTSIELITPPLVVDYIEGQYFDPTGMSVMAHYSNQTSDIVSKYSYTPITPLEYTGSFQTITIRYVENGVECETGQSIYVVEKVLTKIEIENIRNDSYLVGEYVLKESITVRAYFNDDTSRLVTDFDLIGEQEALLETDIQVEVSYQYGHIVKYATYPITVNPKILTNIKIKRKPYRLIYENLTENNVNLSGLILSMEFNNKLWVDFDYDVYLSNKTAEVPKPNNENLINGNNIYCTLDENENEEQRIVTIKYKEVVASADIFKETQYVVYNKKTSLQTMYISSQPSKRKYFVGEKFVSNGMTVKGNYLNQTSKEQTIIVETITSICEIDKNPIGLDDQYAYIYYKNDEGTITNQTRVAITVNERDVDNSKQDQTELTYSCDSGTASVNLFNRRLSFEHFDVSIGANTYTTTCSHIYNSLFEEQYSLRYGTNDEDYYKTRMGVGFKLTLQQYLIYDKTYERYIYIDSVGYRHSFISLGDGVRYYDTTGTNLLLKQVGSQYLIYDLSGNKMYFENGVLVKQVSCFSDEYAKIYKYYNGRLIEAYDKRKPSNKIKFIYNTTTDLLSSILCIKEVSGNENIKKQINFIYTTIGGAHYLEKIINGDITTIFKYGGNKKLIQVYDEKTLSCLEYGYEGNLIKTITSGIINSYQGKILANQIIQKNIIDSNRDGYIITVRNQKRSYVDNAMDVVMEYHFNARGYTVAVLEKDLGYVNKLKTLQKEPGIEVEFSNYTMKSSPIINEGYSYGYSKGRMCYSTQQFNDLEKLTTYRLGKCNNYDNFTISFWAKLNYVLNDPKISVVIHSTSTIFKQSYTTGDAILDNTAIGVWQLVNIPIQILEDNIKEVTISMKTNFWQGVNICDVRLYSSPAASFNILSNYDYSLINIDKAEKIVYTLASNNQKVEKGISESSFITQDDLKYTVLNMYKNKHTSNTSTSTNSFILSMCDGTKKVWVKEASIAIYNNGMLTYYPIGLKKIIGSEIYRVLYSNEIVSPDNEMTTKDYLDIYTAYTIGNYTGPVIKGTTIARSNEKNPVSSKIVTYADFFGRVLQEVDEYGVTTTYQYNEFGEATNKTISHSDTTETIEFTTCRTDTKTVEESKTSVNTTDYNDVVGYMESTSYNGYEEAQANTLNQTFLYNDDITRLEKVSNNLNGKNVLTYKNNMLSEITPTEYSTNSSYGYEIDYDRYGNPSKYYVLSGINKAKQLLTESSTDYQNGTITNKQYRQSETESDDVTIQLNKYGKTTYISETSNGEIPKQTKFIYQTLNESSGAAQVATVEDPYEQRTYTYDYDEYNKCKGYNAISPLGNFSIEKTGPTEVTYFKKSCYEKKFAIDYDNTKLMSPRIKQTIGNGQWETYYTTSDYEYDALGRLSKKTIDANLYNTIEIANTYLPGTLLKENIEIKLDYGLEAYKSYKYSYDSRGRILKIIENGVDNYEFTYDRANRLESEKLKSGITTTYEYNIDGTIKSEITTGSEKVNYAYEKGRLIQRGNQNFTYDNIGNCLTYNGKQLVWHRGKLLKQYDETTYSYDNKGIRFKKECNGKTTVFLHEDGKIIDEIRGNDRISYFYDASGINSFLYNGIKFYYIKDGLGNIRSILTVATPTKSGERLYNLKEVARYDYDAWGNCTVTETSNSIIDGVNIAQFNPIRWKSLYYDTESGLYYIDGRYYSPETKQYLSSQNIETILSNTTTIYGLNLYTPTITNPLDIAPNGYTIETVMELSYDPPELSKWKRFWNSTLGKIIAVKLAALAIALCIITGNIPMLLVSAGLVLGSLLIGAIIGGYQSTVKGKSFWQGFASYVNRNWAQSVAMSSIMLISSGITSYINYANKIITFGIGTILGGMYGGISAAINGQNIVAGILINSLVGGLTGLTAEFKSITNMLIGTFLVGAVGDIVSQMLLDGKSIYEVNFVSVAFAGMANTGLAVVGRGLSSISNKAELTIAESITFGTITNSPLLGLGMAINMVISKYSMKYTLNDLQLV